MPVLLNYTTRVPVSRTLSEVQQILVRAGARSVSAHFDAAGEPVGVDFVAETPLGPRSFQLPVAAERVLRVLERQTREPRYRTPEQARRVAWRIAKDWLEAQVALLATEMVSLDQLLLPYMQAEDGRTVYDLYVERAIPALGAGS